MMKLLFSLILFGSTAMAAESLQIPPLTSPVVDQARMMTAEDWATLDALIRDFHQLGHGQIQVLTLPNLAGLPIEQASIQIVDRWKLGDKKRDDGVLILVAAQERRMRIEVGQGLEGVLPDIKAKRIIEDVMVPIFRQGSPSKGILVGTFQVMKTIDPEFNPESVNTGLASDMDSQPESLTDRFPGLFILVFVVFMILMSFLRPRRRSFWGGYGGWGGGGFGGGGWGGGSSGGGWSGGGGGFSGGGASGSW